MVVQIKEPLVCALRELIFFRGLTFEGVAEKTPIGKRTLYDWAAGKRPIPEGDRFTLATLLGCEPEHLAPLASGVTGQDIVQYLQEKQQHELEQGREMKRRDFFKWG